MLKKYKKILLGCLLILYIPSFFRFFETRDYWLVEILSHFSVQYAFLAFIIFIICIRKQCVTLAVLAGFLFIYNIGTIIDYGETIHAAEHTGTHFKIYSANIQKDNVDLLNLTNEIHEINPDIVFLMEVMPKHNEQLRSIMLAYPYQIENVSPGTLGLVFLSKFPVHNYNFTKLSDFGNSLLEAKLDINKKAVMFYGIHAQRPDRADLNERKRQFLETARQIREQSLPAIVAGDFNTTHYSPIFKELVETAELKDSRTGFGWQPSWPTYFPPLWIPIDHVLVTADIQVRKRTTGSFIGSDHYPVIVELTLS